jgi:hypothetical protein
MEMININNNQTTTVVKQQLTTHAMVPLAARYWAFMCAYDDVQYNENKPSIILGLPQINKRTNAFFVETNMLRAHDLLINAIQYCDATRFPVTALVPEVVNQLQTFSLRTVPFNEMQQQQIGLDLFRFWPNTGPDPKFTIQNFQNWLFALSDLFNIFFHDYNTKYNTTNFICTKIDTLNDKLSDMRSKNIELSELYIFNMATQVVDAVSKMATWAHTTIDSKSASLDPIKKIFQTLETKFDHITESYEGVIVEFIRFPEAVMEFYNRDY